MKLNRKKIVIALVGAWVSIGLLATVMVYEYAQTNTKSEYVTFDTVKYVSARREMTTRLLGSNESAKQEAISVLAKVEKSTMPVIDKFAKGKIVIVKQALVLNEQVPDITDLVLNELGLPTDTKSISPQLPQKVLTPYSTSDEYVKSAKSNKDAVEAEAAELKQRKEFENAVKSAERKAEISQYLP